MFSEIFLSKSEIEKISRAFKQKFIFTEIVGFNGTKKQNYLI
jgi:hypothetical protein